MINKFSCHNFRNINADNLEFEKINILIGPNNSGKSNFIKAITFFSEMLKNSGEGNLKSAFLNAVARNGWEHSLYKHADPDAPIDFTWEICLNGEPVRYKFSFGVGSTVEKCNIVLEELSSAEPKMGYDREFNYFRCHDHKIGLGNFSTAIKVGAKNRRLAFEVDSKETLIMQFKDILLKNQNIYGNELIRVNIAQLLYELQKYFEGFSVYTSAQFESGKLRVIDVTRESFFAGIKMAKAGNHLYDISNAIDAYVKPHGYGIVRDLVGHGIGTSLHEDPQIPNFAQRRRGLKLQAGMTLAIEPMINMGRADVEWLDDDWTVVTEDGSWSAHYENTVLITEGEPEILTLY